MMRRYLPWALLGGLAMATALGLWLGLAAAPVAIRSTCPNTQLGARVTSGGSEASQPFVIIAVTNKGARCFVDGYPRITAVSGHKVQSPTRPLPIWVIDGADYEHHDPGAHLITLNRGSAASFALGTTTASGTLYAITALSVTLPGDSTPLRVSVHTAASAWSGSPIPPVGDRIRMWVTAFVSGAIGPPTG